MKLPVTAIFDIGKTNKKFLLFDEEFNEIHRRYTTLPETQDEDGFACEDLPALTQWMRNTLQKAVESKDFQVTRLNISTYGASLVHLDAQQNPVAPLYNYLKPLPAALKDDFYAMVGGQEKFCLQTASPALGMLNSGLQLYWLQREKPAIFARIKHSLHLPQYCSWLFSKQLCSEYTSIGCHTGLWDFTRHRYHDWVKNTGMEPLLPPILPTTHRIKANVFGHEIVMGMGVHDSSAALLPYLLTAAEPFVLLSTGTWNIAFNPFNHEPLTAGELQQDCLNFLRPDGEPVKASRLFFGNEFNVQTQRMAAHFNRHEQNYQHTVVFDKNLYQKWKNHGKPVFRWESLQNPGDITETDWAAFGTFEDAFHCLMIGLMALQKHSLQLAIGSTPVRKIFVDGGFSQSDVFINLLLREMPGYEIIVSSSPLGSSLGAALLVQDRDDGKTYGFEQNRVSMG